MTPSLSFFPFLNLSLPFSHSRIKGKLTHCMFKEAERTNEPWFLNARRDHLGFLKLAPKTERGDNDLSAGHITVIPTQPAGNGTPSSGIKPMIPAEKSLSLPTEPPRPKETRREKHTRQVCKSINSQRENNRDITFVSKNLYHFN